MESNYTNIICQIMNTTVKSGNLDLSTYTNDEQFLRIIKEQTFSPFLYHINKNKIWRPFYLQAYTINEKFNILMRDVSSIFDNENIDYIFLKGSELKSLYPLEFLRQMGDIDILVRKRDYQKAKEILKQHKYNFVDEINYHSSFTKNGLNLELHNNLMPSNESFFNYFKNPFKNAIKISKNQYTFDSTYNIIYLIQHYIKHLKSGAGLREICDIYLFLANNDINVTEVRNVLKNNRCEGFLDSLLTIIDTIFDFKKYSYTPVKDINLLIEFSLKSGIHGFGKNNTRVKNEFVTSSKNKLSYLLKKWFIPIRKLYEIYPYTKSIILIPLGYLIRLFHLISKRQKELNIVVNSQKDEDILKKFGIK